MKFGLDNPHEARIRAYGAGYVVVGERRIAATCLLAGARVRTDALPRDVTDLDEAFAAEVAGLGVDVLVVGTGAAQRFPAPEWLAACARNRVGVEVMDTGAACRTYDVLLSEGRRAAALLFMG